MKKTTLRHVGQSMAEGSFDFVQQIKYTTTIYNSRKLLYHYIYRGNIIFRITVLLISLYLLSNLLYANTYCTSSI